MSNLLPPFVNNMMNRATGATEEFELEETERLSNVKNNTIKNNSKKNNTVNNKTLKNNKMLNNSINKSRKNTSNKVPRNNVSSMINSIMDSNLEREDKINMLKVLETNLKQTDKMDNAEINEMRNKYSQPQYPVMPQPQYPIMPQPQFQPQYSVMPYPQFQPQYPMMMPQSMPQYQMPNPQIDMLTNKVNTMQLEMADLMRHMKDYTRKYMDVVRQDDMERIREYIKDLTEMKDTINNAKLLAQATEEQEEPEEEGNIMDTATNTIKNGLSTLTNAANSIGEKMGISNNTQVTNKTSEEEEGQEEVQEEVEEEGQEEVEEELEEGGQEEVEEEGQEEGQEQQEEESSNMMSLEEYNKNNLAPKNTTQDSKPERNLESELTNELASEELGEEELGEEELGEEELGEELKENEMGNEPLDEELESDMELEEESQEDKDKIFNMKNNKPKEELGEAVKQLNQANKKNQSGGSKKNSTVVNQLKNKKSKKRKPMNRDTELKRKMAIRAYYAKKSRGVSSKKNKY